VGALTGQTQIAHLLRRAGFGATPAELEAYAQLGFNNAVDRLLNPDQVDDDLDAKVAALNLDMSKPGVIMWLWFYRMLNTKRPLQEKMALFWHGHFATAISKVGSAELMWNQSQLFRQMGLGNFEDLVVAVSKDPAMLIWLDNRTNRKQAPNENYGRELMELFTLGIGNYTELDVRAAARAFTGWNMKVTQRQPNGKRIAAAEFFFNARQHDDGQKTFLGQTGNWNGDDIIRIILAKPASAQFIVGKMFSFFVWDNPDAATLQPFVDVYTKSHYDLRATMQAILRSPQFSSEQAYRAKIKSPAEAVVEMMKQLGVTVPPPRVVVSTTLQGQQLFNPPNVGGWTSGLGWISTNSLLERYNFANALLTGQGEGSIAAALKNYEAQRGGGTTQSGAALAAVSGASQANGQTRMTGRPAYAVNPATLLAGKDLSTPESVVDACLGLFLDGDVAASIRTALVSYLKLGADGKPGTFTLNDQTMDDKVRGVLHLTMTAPTYQLN